MQVLVVQDYMPFDEYQEYDEIQKEKAKHCETLFLKQKILEKILKATQRLYLFQELFFGIIFLGQIIWRLILKVYRREIGAILH